MKRKLEQRKAEKKETSTPTTNTNTNTNKKSKTEQVKTEKVKTEHKNKKKNNNGEVNNTTRENKKRKNRETEKKEEKDIKKPNKKKQKTEVVTIKETSSSSVVQSKSTSSSNIRPATSVSTPILVSQITKTVTSSVPVVPGGNWKKLQVVLEKRKEYAKKNKPLSEQMLSRITAKAETETTTAKDIESPFKTVDEVVKTLIIQTADQEENPNEITKTLAMDCEMVGVGSLENEESVLARIAIVNSYGNCIYDKFVLPKEKVVNYRTHVSGVRKQDLQVGKAEKFEVVQKEVAEILKDKIIVGHALHNDFQALLLDHPFKMTRDTAKYPPLQRSKGKPRSLRDLAERLLKVQIQEGEHSPVEDARTVLLLYKFLKKDWEEYMLKKHDRRRMNMIRQQNRKIQKDKLNNKPLGTPTSSAD